MRKIYSILILLLVVGQAFAVDMNANNGNQSKITKLARITPPSEMEELIDPNEYIVGVGDEFLVELQVEKTSIVVPVVASGELLIPGAGTFLLSGKTLSESLALIKSNLSNYAKVSFFDVKNIRIPVVGAVLKPGIYSVKGNWRLSDVIKSVPLKYLSKDFEINIIDGQDTSVVNIYDFYLKGDKKSNPYLHAGETIYIPFADPVSECVEVYGPVMARSFIPFIQGETLGEFYRRKVVMSDVMNYEKIMVVRQGKQILVSDAEMDAFVLHAKDKIEFIALKQIMVSGHVNRPGTYDFVPGHTVIDYISMAGGTNYKGSNGSAIVIRDSKKIKNPKDMQIHRGDIILVKRSAEDILIGEISILSFVSLIATIASTVITALIAAGNI